MRFQGILLSLLLPALVWGTTFEERPFATLATQEELLARASAATTEAYPDADTVTLHDGEHVLYDAKGRSLDVAEVCTKILTERGRREARTQSLYYSAHYSVAPRFVVAEILHADGKITTIDPAKHTKEQIDRSSMESNIYDPNNKIVELTIPELQIGDSLHLVIERESFKARVENSWSDYALFEGTSPILYAIYEVQSPKALPIRSQQLRDPQCAPEYTTQTQDTATLHRWEFRDIPQVFPEPNTPPLYTCVQRLLLSTESDWRDLSRWYDRLCQPRLDAVHDAMREKVAELTKDCATDEARIRVLFDFVSQQIRYMGITDEEVSPGYEPHDVSLTFDNRYGVCRDKAALLVAMLRLANLKAHPVLISAGARKDPDVPQPFFNHAIVCVDKGSGSGKDRYILMDPTNEKSRDLFPAYLYNDDFLVASPEGETLLNAGPAPVLDNLLRVRTTGTLDATRALLLESTLAFEGINDSIYRNGFAQMKPEERERYFESVLRKCLPGAEILSASIQPEDIGDTSQPLTATLRYRVADVPIDGEGAWMIRLPWISSSLGFSGRILGSTGLEKRRFPLEILPTCGEDESIEIDFAPHAIGGPLSLPTPIHIHSGAIDFAHEASFSDGKLHAKRHTHLLAAQVETADYAALRDDLHRQESALRRQAIFAPGSAAPAPAPRANTAPPQPPSPDAEILLSEIKIDLQSEHSWTRTETTRTRVLTYAGVKARSELTFNYNPAIEKVEIVSASVTAPDGTVQTISPKEINVMDAAWVSSAPRYPAAKTLVVSLPGVQEGSLLETTVRTTSWDRPWFTAALSFRGSDPISSASLMVTLPEDAPYALRLHENDPSHPAIIESTQGRTSYSWHFENLPALQPENRLPPSWLRSPAIQISAQANYSAWHSALVARLTSIAQNPDTSAAARLKGASLALAPDGSPLPREAAIRAIRDFVATSIRMAGPSFLDLPSASAFTDPDIVLAEGYGHQADTVLLLLTLLEGAGIHETEIIPVSTFGSNSPDIVRPLLDIPMTRMFSKLLLRVPTPNGSDFWLGDTDQYAPLETTLAEQSLALATDSSPFQIQPTRTTRPENLTFITLSQDGAATLQKQSFYTGTTIGPFRKKFLEMRPEDRRRYHLELVGAIARGAQPKGDLLTETESYPGLLAYSATVETYAVRDGKMLYLSLPDLPTNPLGINSAKARENDFYLGPQSPESISTLRISLPPETARVLIAPPSQTLSIPELGSITCETKLTPEAITITRTLRLTEGLVPAGRYSELVALSETLQHPRFSTILVELNTP